MKLLRIFIIIAVVFLIVLAIRDIVLDRESLLGKALLFFIVFCIPVIAAFRLAKRVINKYI